MSIHSICHSSHRSFTSDAFISCSIGFRISNCNPGQNSLGQYCNIPIFLLFLGSLLKQCIIFEIFLQFSLPPSPNPIQSWNSEKILNTLVQHCLWGEGSGLTCVKWKTPPTRKCVPRLLSMILGFFKLPWIRSPMHSTSGNYNKPGDGSQRPAVDKQTR